MNECSPGKPASRDPQREVVSFRLGKARLQDLFALVAQMRAQDVGEAGAITLLQRVQDRLVLLHGEGPALRCHRRTPAHGTAYDVAGQGIASIGASRAALLLAAEMAARRAA